MNTTRGIRRSAATPRGQRERRVPTHTEDCYILLTECVHEHTAECYSDGVLPAEAEEKEPDACTHQCSEGSGCITKKPDCKHEHKVNVGEADREGGPGRGEACGYAPATEGTPCGYACEICNPQDSVETEEPGPQAECICTGLCTEGTVNPDCPVCGAEGADLTACKGEAPAEPVCTCTALCAEGSANPECPVCSAEGADLTACIGAESEMAALPNALAAEGTGVMYLDEKGEKQTTGADTPVTVLNPSVWKLEAGWYVVNGAVNFPNESITVSGDVHLILADGCEFNTRRGIRVSEGGSLTIYAQSTGGQMGRLISDRDWIGCDEGGQITINGGDVFAHSDGGYSGISCEGGGITINGGNVTASSSYGSGIGIGSSRPSAGTITINGGTVDATGGSDSAGIGGGGVAPLLTSVSPSTAAR